MHASPFTTVRGCWSQIGHININGSSREDARSKLAALDPAAAATLRKTTAAMAAAMGAAAQPQAQVSTFKQY